MIMLLGMCDAGKSMQRLGHHLEETGSSQTKDEIEHLEHFLLDPGFQDFLHLESEEGIFDPNSFISVDKEDPGFSSGQTSVVVSRSPFVTNSHHNTALISSVQHAPMPLIHTTCVPHQTCWHRSNESHTSSCYQPQQLLQKQPIAFSQTNEDKLLSVRPAVTGAHHSGFLSSATTSTDLTDSSKERTNPSCPLKSSKTSCSEPGTLSRTMTSPIIHVQTPSLQGSNLYNRTSHLYHGNLVGTRQPMKPGCPSPYQIPKKVSPPLQTSFINTSASHCRYVSKAAKDSFQIVNPPQVYGYQNQQYLDSKVTNAVSSSEDIFSRDCLQEDILAVRTEPGYCSAGISIICSIRTPTLNSAKEVMFLCEFVCEQDNSKTYTRILMQFSGCI